MRGVIDSLSAHAQARPNATCVEMFSRRLPKSAARALTWAQLQDAVEAAAAELHARGVRKGDVVVLIGTYHLDLYAVWLGAVWLGAIPTILAEPSVRQAPEVYWSRLDALITRIEPRLVSCDPKYLAKLRTQNTTDVPLVGFDAVVAGGRERAVVGRAAVEDDDVLLLQHSSGTTGLQKGVVLTHGAVAAHATSYSQAIALNEADVIASWLPLYHDMGLIAAFLGPLLAGARVVWMSPFEWVAAPTILLDAVTQHRATLAWLPNFAFAFLAARAPAAARYELGTLRAVVSCSEPVTGAALDAFSARFAQDGLRPGALQACFAMAENVFAMTSTTLDRPPLRRVVDRERWQQEHQAVDATGGPSIEWVGSGRAIDGVQLRIVDDSGSPQPPGTAGRVLIKSPFLFRGYFRVTAPAAIDDDGFFDTGDLGFVDADGELFVTGRKKDLVIVGGKNVYPQDVEDVVGALDGAHPGRAVCFGVRVPALDTEGLVVLLESELDEAQWPELAQRARAVVPAQLDLDLADVRVVARGSLRKSSSGKLARAGNREWYLDGRFGAPLPQLGNS